MQILDTQTTLMSLVSILVLLPTAVAAEIEHMGLGLFTYNMERVP